jgi:hypothetical protein
MSFSSKNTVAKIVLVITLMATIACNKASEEADSSANTMKEAVNSASDAAETAANKANEAATVIQDAAVDTANKAVDATNGAVESIQDEVAEEMPEE